MKKFISSWFRAELSTVTETALLGLVQNEVYDESEVNYSKYAETLCNIYEQFDKQGYDVINVLPIQNGQKLKDSNNNLHTFGVTRGAVVIGKLREPTI